jgi:hypothetical protein
MHTPGMAGGEQTADQPKTLTEAAPPPGGSAGALRRKRTATISAPPDRFAHSATAFRHRRADRSPHPPTTQRAHPAGHRPIPSTST